MLQKLINLVKNCFVSQVLDDSKTYAIIEVSHDDRTIVAQNITQYGLYSNPPKNATGIVILIGADASKAAAIVNVDDERFKNLEEGEVAVGNPLTTSKIFFDKDGNIIEFSKNNLTINVTNDNNITVSGEYSLNVIGNASIVSTTEIQLTAPSIILGSGGAGSGLVTFTDLKAWTDSHVHSDPQGGVTGVSTTQLSNSAQTNVVKGS